MTSTAPPSGSAASSAAATASLPNAWRIEVFRQEGVDDPEGVHARAALLELGLEGITAVRLGRGYLLPTSLERSAVERVMAELLVDPVVDTARVTEPGEARRQRPGPSASSLPKSPASWTRWQPPSTRPSIACSPHWGSRPAARPAWGRFQAWEIFGELSGASVDQAVRTALANEVIEEIGVGAEGLHFGAPLPGRTTDASEMPLLGLDQDGLMKLSTEGGSVAQSDRDARGAEALPAEGREPSLCELETIAQTWSEHCPAQDVPRRD